MTPSCSVRARPCSLLAAAALAVAGAWSHPCRAQCEPATGVSPCIDADPVWFPTGATRFVTIPASHTIEPGRYGIGFGLTYFDDPVVFGADSPDPEGRKIRAVDDALDASLLFGAGLTDRVEIGAALPFRLLQHGAGVEGVTSQEGAPITTSAARDARVGGSVALFPRARAPGGIWGAKAGLELTLPLGNEEAFAGDRSLVAAPSISADLDVGRFFAAAVIGARLRKPTTVAGATLGSQIVASLGAGVDVLPRERLSLAAEAWTLPTLASQDRDLPNGGRVKDATLLPAEWMASIRSSPFGEGDFTLLLGAGAAIPLSKETRVAPDGTETLERFAGVTAARFRVAFVIRYVPLGRDTDADALPDADDDCPDTAEDRDGFEDADGCPDPDDDADGIPDAADRCRAEPEDRDGHEDADGCPEPRPDAPRARDQKTRS